MLAESEPDHFSATLRTSTESIADGHNKTCAGNMRLEKLMLETGLRRRPRGSFVVGQDGGTSERPCRLRSNHGEKGME
jgi:hypothetical protein